MLAHPWAFWLSLGGLLLIAEMLGANGYLLWCGVAAMVTGALRALVPLSWEWQGLCFAVLMLAAAWGWWRWLASHQARHTGWVPNQRGRELLGQILTLDNNLQHGRGNVRLGDSSWPVVADQDLPAGTRVTVVAIEGITLRVAPLP